MTRWYSRSRSGAARWSGRSTRSILAGLLALTGVAPMVAAVEPDDSPNLLDRPRVDVAVLETTAPNGVPRLLVVDPLDDGATSAHLEILERDGPWRVVSELDVGIDGGSGELVRPPWLVGLGDDRFALILAFADRTEIGVASDRTVIQAIHTRDPAGRPALAARSMTTIDARVDSAGRADVFADGMPELIVATNGDPRGQACAGSHIRVLDRVTLREQGSMLVDGLRLGGGVIGAWAGVRGEAGEDLMAYARPTCAVHDTSGTDLRLIQLDLAAGRIEADRPAGSPGTPAWISSPMRVDIDGDGMDEILAQSPRGLALMDPRRDWDGARVATARAVPLAATPWPADRPGGLARVAWLEPATERPGTIGTELVTRDPADGTIAGSPATVSFAGGMASDRWSAIEATSLAAASLQRPLVGWLGDLADAGCADLVLPGSVQGCSPDARRPGAAWVTSRPLTLLGDERRRLLVASGVDFDPDTGLMQAPTPVASDLPGWWRHGPSAAFVLAELRADDAIYFRDFPSPRATVEQIATSDTSTTVPGFTGVRFVFAATGEAEGVPDSSGPLGLREALTVVRRPGLHPVVGRVPVPPGVDAGRDGSAAQMDLSQLATPGGGPVDQWSVTVIPINDWGEVGAAARGTVRRDEAAPFVSVVVPFTTPVWPARATLAGTAEPRTTVEVDGVGPIELDRRGRFTFEMSLAPWPQTVRVTATDASGNRTVHEASIIGGVDYRAFPWPMIMAVALLGAVIGSGVIGTRRQRFARAAGGPIIDDFENDAAGPELEELPPGSGLGTAR